MHKQSRMDLQMQQHMHATSKRTPTKNNHGDKLCQSTLDVYASKMVRVPVLMTCAPLAAPDSIAYSMPSATAALSDWPTTVASPGGDGAAGGEEVMGAMARVAAVGGARGAVTIGVKLSFRMLRSAL